jgi:hypothetical protein
MWQEVGVAGIVEEAFRVMQLHQHGPRALDAVMGPAIVSDTTLSSLLSRTLHLVRQLTLTAA